jgi:hypothetical protein
MVGYISDHAVRFGSPEHIPGMSAASVSRSTHPNNPARTHACCASVGMFLGMAVVRLVLAAFGRGHGRDSYREATFL